MTFGVGHIAWYSFIAGATFTMALDVLVHKNNMKAGLLLTILCIVSAFWAFVGA